jgi:nucleoside-diphosphate-sugar epimerase
MRRLRRLAGGGLEVAGALRVLVIGGSRFIGAEVVRKLVKEGHRVTVFNRGKSANEVARDVHHIRGDVAELGAHRDELAKVGADVVVHMIAYTEADGRAFVETFEGIAGRAVVISSMDVYRIYDRLRRLEEPRPDGEMVDEESELRERLFPYRAKAKDEKELVYNYEKILVEREVMGRAGIAASVLRLPAVYGAGDYQHRLFPYIKRMADGRGKILLGEKQSGWRWTRGYVENVADAIVLAVSDSKAVGRIYNVGEPEALSEAEWVERIGRVMNWKGQIATAADEKLPGHLREDFDWDHHWVADTGRIRGELGYKENASFEEGLAKTVEWERENPPAKVDAGQFDYAAEDAVLA